MKLHIPLIFVIFPLMVSAQPLITYELNMTKPSTHLFEVSISIENLQENQNAFDLILPVWRPGRYLIFDFASGVQEFSASDEKNNLLKWKKINKTTWRIELDGNKKLTAKYKVFANEFNLRTRGLNTEHGFVDETSVFMYSETYRKVPVILNVYPYDGWHVTTGLDNNHGQPNSFTAPDYDYFV